MSGLSGTSVSDTLIAELINVSDVASRSLAAHAEEFFEWAPIGLKVSQSDGKERSTLLDVGDDGDPSQKAVRNRNVTAAQSLQIQVQTQSMIRVIHDLLKLNRTVKEAHLFGGLKTLGGAEVDAQTEADARAVAEALSKLLSSSSNTESGQAEAS